MLPEITTKDIEYAQKVLLPSDRIFDEERCKFIKCLKTADLQAVPGSGKTTALLAKLVILEKQLPFDNGGGILVLSHTNTAVDEITERLGKVAPNLFVYPSFVGTIQSFVDTFLAIPYYTNKYGYGICRIDDEICKERCEDAQKHLYAYGLKKFAGLTKCRYKDLNEKQLAEKQVAILMSLSLDDNGELLSLPGGLKDPVTPTAKALRSYKQDLIKYGILTYADAYQLAKNYIHDVPAICTILQKRFPFVFVDEMQDMNKTQIDLLEDIFFKADSITCFQRIGDMNQAIYGEDSGDDANEGGWCAREPTLHLNGSMRLSSEIANVVEHFALQRQEIKGLQMDNIKPHIIVYEKQDIKKVIPKFIKIVHRYKDKGKLPPNDKYAAIGWRKRKDANHKTALPDYWDKFPSDDVKKKIDYGCLNDYLVYFDREKETLAAVRKSILNAILKVLRLEEMKNPSNEQNYTITSLIERIKENAALYEDFKLKLFRWCKAVFEDKECKEITKTKSDITGFLQEIVTAFGGSLTTKTDAFINDTNKRQSEAEKPNASYVYDCDIDLKVGTIHSVKGQTYTGVLYLETFKGQQPTKGEARDNRTFESQKLSSYITGSTIGGNNETSFIKEALKMAYVGFSRPTHLLCIAVEKEHFDKCLRDINKETCTWNIENV